MKPEKYKHIQGWNDINILYEEVFYSLINSNSQELNIVEVGCWQGRSAMFMLELIKNHSEGDRFVNVDLIDVWGKFENGYVHDFIRDHGGNIVDKIVNNLRSAELLLPQVNIIQKSTFKAVKMYDDNSLDFVYLDNDHSYEHLVKELDVWYPKIKSGGMLGGDDYVNETFTGVKKAVDEFAIKHGLEITFFDLSFLIIKP